MAKQSRLGGTKFKRRANFVIPLTRYPKGAYIGVRCNDNEMKRNAVPLKRDLRSHLFYKKINTVPLMSNPFKLGFNEDKL